MKLSEVDARRVLSFCLSREHQVEVSQTDGQCTVRIAPPEEQAHVFEGPGFIEALRAAADAGVVRGQCIERQIAFVMSHKSRPYDAPPPVYGADTTSEIAVLPDPDPVTPGPTGRLTMGHYRGLAEFRYQIRKFVSFSERAARHAGLEPQQHQLMLSIAGLPPPKRANLPTLAERMCIDIGACETIVGGLIARGLVRWTANASDRREQLMTLTPAGRKILRRLTEMHRNQMLTVGPKFVQVLGAILSSIEDADSKSTGTDEE